jgi:hypothetical protein
LRTRAELEIIYFVKDLKPKPEHTQYLPAVQEYVPSDSNHSINSVKDFEAERTTISGREEKNLIKFAANVFESGQDGLVNRR